LAPLNAINDFSSAGAIVTKAVLKLKKAGAPISLGRIADATRELTASGRGVSQSTILRNPACKAIYEREVKPAKKAPRVRRILRQELEGPSTEVEIRRLRYLLRFTKAEIAAMTIRVERDLAISNNANELLRDQLLSVSVGPLI
jgi:hypothetical protein